MKKEVAGQPVWVWAIGAGVVILGYWYFSRKAGTAGSSGQPAGGGQYKSTDNLKETITSWQGPPSKPPPAPKPPPKHHHKRG